MKKMKKAKPQTLKGFRDFLPEEMMIREKVIRTLKEVFASYGFAPFQTPSLEYTSTLLGKYGQEADKLVYTFKDKGQRDVGLIYDLTVPVSRVLALYSQKVSFPFKRYQIQRVWRAEKPQQGRYREILQCDLDTFGSDSPLADAEIIAVIYDSLKKLKFEKFTIRINSRQSLFQTITSLGIKSKEKQLSLLQTIDKLANTKPEKVEEELVKKGLTKTQVKKLFSLLENAQPDQNLEKVFDYLKLIGIKKEAYCFAPALVRGLDYYTGPVFETYVEKPKIGSITGGGRYDKLISQLGGPDIPATGTTIGLDRICEVIKENNLWPEIRTAATQVLVTVFSPETLKESLKLAGQLRKEKIKTELYLEPQAKLDKQLKYADRKRIPFALILGPQEIKAKRATLKNLDSGKQETLTIKQIISRLNPKEVRPPERSDLL